MDSRLTQRVAVLVPSRDRPEKLAGLCRSILSTGRFMVAVGTLQGATR